jgi:hypothetical protein
LPALGAPINANHKFVGSFQVAVQASALNTIGRQILNLGETTQPGSSS